MRLKIINYLKDLRLNPVTHKCSFRGLSMILITFLFIAYMKILVYYYARAEHNNVRLKPSDKLNITTENASIGNRNIFLESITSIDEYLKQLSELNKRLNERKTDDSLHAMLSIHKHSSTRLLFPEKIVHITEVVTGNDVCDRSHHNQLTLLIIVCVSVENFERRQLIRDTWALALKSKQSDARLLFAVANTDNATTKQILAEEVYTFKDIIQFGFYDSSDNTTLKSLAIIRWTLLNCPLVKYLLKADDRTLINSEQILNYLMGNPLESGSIYGEVAKTVTVSRSVQPHDTYISVDDYPSDVYPNFIRHNYLIPAPVLMPLYETAIVDSLPALPFDDIYLTGIVAQKSFIAITSSPLMVSVRLKKNSNYCSVRKYFVVSLDWDGSDNTKEFRDAWNRFNQKNMRCVKRKKPK